MRVVPLTPAVVAMVVAMVVAVVVAMAAGVTAVDGASLRRSNSNDDYQDNPQLFYGFHANYGYSVACPRTLELFNASPNKRTTSCLASPCII